MTEERGQRFVSRREFYGFTGLIYTYIAMVAMPASGIWIKWMFCGLALLIGVGMSVLASLARTKT